MGYRFETTRLSRRLWRLHQERKKRHREDRGIPRGQLTKHERTRILESTGGRCHICGGRIQSKWCSCRESRFRLGSSQPWPRYAHRPNGELDPDRISAIPRQLAAAHGGDSAATGSTQSRGRGRGRREPHCDIGIELCDCGNLGKPGGISSTDGQRHRTFSTLRDER